MEKMRKRVAWLVGLWIVCLLGAGCTSRETVAFEAAPEELPAVQGCIIPLGGKEWPVNEYTEGIPCPEEGQVDRGWIDGENRYCFVELSSITPSAFSAYTAELETAGFEPMEEVSEALAGQDLVSIGTILRRADCWLSISYLEGEEGTGRMGLYIAREPA